MVQMGGWLLPLLWLLAGVLLLRRLLLVVVMVVHGSCKIKQSRPRPLLLLVLW
jgi:hypothetical protein